MWNWRHAPVPHASILANVPSELIGAGAGPLPVFSTYTLIRSRRETSGAELQVPAQRASIRIRILPSLFGDGGHYRATLERIEAGGEKIVVRDIDDLQAADDRFVSLYLDSAQLTPGQYELSLVGPDTAASPEADRFAIHAE